MRRGKRNSLIYPCIIEARQEGGIILRKGAWGGKRPGSGAKKGVLKYTDEFLIENFRMGDDLLSYWGRTGVTPCTFSRRFGGWMKFKRIAIAARARAIIQQGMKDGIYSKEED